VGRDGNRTRYECSDSQNLGIPTIWSGVGKTLEELVGLYLAYDSLKLKMSKCCNYCQ
jgi:hypothetical protein